MDYHEESIKIWEKYVPKTGQADTVQGELMRAVEKLAMEAVKNENHTWDESCEILVSYLEQHLLDTSVFDKSKFAKLSQAIERIKKYEEPYNNTHFYNVLTEGIVDYYFHYGSQKNLFNPKLER